MAATFRTAAYAVVVAVTVGCATAPTAARDPRPPAVLASPPEEADGRHHLEPPQHADPADPAAVAVELVLDGLAAEGLVVTAIDAEIRRQTATAASVRVTVAHSPGRGHPHQSTYDLDLEPDGTGWQVTSATEPDP